MDATQATKRPRRAQLALTAGGMALALAAVYAACGFWPFGPNSVATGDLNSQYLPFYAHFYDAVRGGGSLFYAGDLGMGGGAFGLFAYYFASPFAWVYLLVDPVWYSQLCNLVLAAKLALAAAAFVFFAQRHWAGLAPAGCWLWPALGWCYGLMGYAVAYSQNVLWLDAVILLPLVCAGLDRLAAGRGSLGFAFALAATIFTNFYMGYMLCLFSALYFAATLLSGTAARGGRAAARAAGRFFLAGALAAALAGAVLLPAAAEILKVKNPGGALSGGAQFSLPDLVQKFFTGSFVWQDVQTGLPPLYCGMLGLGSFLLWAAWRRPAREKLAWGGAAAALLASLWLRPLDLAWHGFAAPNWFPYRESFLLVFLLLTLGAGALAGGVSLRRGLAAGAAGAALGVLVYFFRAETYGRRRWLLACCLLAAAIGLAWLWGRLAGRRRAVCAAALAVLAAADLALNAVWSLRLFEVYPVADYAGFVAGGRAAAAAVAQADGEGLRVEKTALRTLNDPMLLGYDGLTHFSSVQEGGSAILMMALGYRNYGSCYGYLSGSTAAADSLLSVGWFLAREGDTAPTHFEAAGIAAPWQVYKNPYALPRALFAPGARAEDFALAEGLDPFATVQQLYDGLLVEDAGLFLPVSAAESGASFALTAPASGILYGVFTGTGADVPLRVNGRAAGEVFTVERSSGAVVDLGRAAAGEKVTVELDAAADSALFAVLDEAALSRAAQDIRAAAPVVKSWRDGRVELTAEAGEGGLVLLSVPYSENWRALVDGKTAGTCAAGQLLAVELAAGGHTVVLEWTQPGAAAGTAASLLGAAGAAALALWQKKQKKKESGE